jgi:glycosyltransferase involved in cell wall biosynthesis
VDFEKISIALLQTPSSILNIDLHGGIERVELSQLEYLCKAGHDVKLYASKVEGHKERVYQITDLGYKNRVLKLFYYINFWFQNHKAQIFHGHYTPMLGLLFPNKAVIHFHGLGVSELPLYRHFKNRFHKAHYVFCAKWVREDFKKLYPKIPDSQMHVVYNGVDSETIRPGKKELNSTIKNICFYAGWIPEKGIYDVLKAAEILEQKRNDFKIWYGGSAFSHYKDTIWGKSKEIDAKVRTWAARLKTVNIVGDIKRNNIPEFLSKMDIGLVPSSYPDPFPLVPMEMMAAGIPVIAYDLGGLKELITHGNNGFLVENNKPELLADKIAYFIDNPDRIKEMGDAARKHVTEKFTWEQHVEQLLEIYRKIIGITI